MSLQFDMKSNRTSLLDENYDFELDEWKVKIKYYIDRYFSEVSKRLKLGNIFINLSEDPEKVSWLYWRIDSNDELHVYLCFMDSLGGTMCNDGTIWRHVINRNGISVHYITSDMILKYWEENV